MRKVFWELCFLENSSLKMRWNGLGDILGTNNLDYVETASHLQQRR